MFMDMESDAGCCMDLAMRAQDAGHEVRYWMADETLVGTGVVETPEEWAPSMEWADLIVLSGNCDYPEGFEDYFTQGYPIFGTNPKAAELELDRGEGQTVLEYYGIDILPYQVVDTPEEAIDVLIKDGLPFALKPWGGTADKSMTCIPHDVDEAVFTIEKWKRDGLWSGQLMMQERVDGQEIGISAFFGPGGWSKWKEESFEHKKFMNDDYGGNTGEMGTVIRHVDESILFDKLLAPLTDYLHLVNFIGDCAVNCKVDKTGTPWPLEFTMRLGWPDACIRQEVLKSDPIEWMRDLILGRDTFDVSTDVVVGIVMAHGDFPRSADDPKDWSGFPISGITAKNRKHLHFQQAMRGKAPRVIDGKLKYVEEMLTAGTYPLVVTGSGKTVQSAMNKAYGVVDEIRWPSNVMVRTDIGKRLMEELPLLHQHGYAKKLTYG